MTKARVPRILTPRKTLSVHALAPPLTNSVNSYTKVQDQPLEVNNNEPSQYGLILPFLLTRTFLWTIIPTVSPGTKDGVYPLSNSPCSQVIRYPNESHLYLLKGVPLLSLTLKSKYLSSFLPVIFFWLLGRFRVSETWYGLEVVKRSSSGARVGRRVMKGDLTAALLDVWSVFYRDWYFWFEVAVCGEHYRFFLLTLALPCDLCVSHVDMMDSLCSKLFFILI